MNFIESGHPCQFQPCIKRSQESLESEWITESDYGECYFQPSENQFFSCLIPVYNGAVLRIKPELVHASLSGISIKHFYGKCFQELEENKAEKLEETENEEQFYYEPEELYGYELLDVEQRMSTPKNSPFYKKFILESNSFENQNFNFYGSKETEQLVDERPICMKEKINFRNSFWNLHKPELCKLTWPQKYVSTATIIQHLHNHLTEHGQLCNDFHEEKMRSKMLDKELCEYGRLKIILPPQNLPPDEKFFNFKYDEFLTLKCEGLPLKKSIITKEDRFFNLSEDDIRKSEAKSIYRSKEEFCLTIGRHIRKQPLKKSLSELERQTYIEPETPYNREEESKESTTSFGFDWSHYNPEEYYDEEITDNTSIDLESITEPLLDTCPPLMIDDFCRAVAKADFSDLRCNPDDF